MRKRQEPLNILFYGAGVIGSIFAAKLRRSGHNITVLARGQRLRDIREHGIVLTDDFSGRQTVARVETVEALGPHDSYDLIVVAVRKDQVDEVLPVLAGNTGTKNVLFMVNNPSGPDEWIRSIGPGRLILGFPGAGGAREGHVIRYNIVSPLLQATTFGEPDGRLTPRLRAVARAFKGAGVPVAVSRNMNAWQKSHVAWVSPFANAIYYAGGDNYRLAQLPEGVHLLVRAIREGFRVLSSLGVPVKPARLRIFQWIPEFILVAALRRYMATRHCELVAARHANAARGEMRALADEFLALARQAQVPVPAFERLRTYIDQTQV